MSNPNTDPHTFEASPEVAQTVSQAKLVVQNGLGYDDFMTKIESASPSSSRKVIDVQKLLGVPDSAPEPSPLVQAGDDAGGGPGARRRPVGAPAGPRGLLPGQRTAASTPRCGRGSDALKAFRTRHPGTPVATTEPVGDYMLQAAGITERDAVQHAGRHHERHRSRARRPSPSRTPCSPDTASRCSSTTSR